MCYSKEEALTNIVLKTNPAWACDHSIFKSLVNRKSAPDLMNPFEAHEIPDLSRAKGREDNPFDGP